MADNKEKQRLSATEQSNIMKALYNLINTKEDDIELCFEANNVAGSSVGLFSHPGAVYLSKNINGGFKGLVPFAIRYKSTPKTDNARLAMLDYLNGLSEWLSGQKNPVLSDNRKVEKIEQTEVTYLEFVTDDGALTYVAAFELKYRKDV